MRVQTVLIWVVAAGVLAGLVALVRSAGSDPGPREARAPVTIPIDTARVQRLVRTTPDGPPTVAERTGADAWKLRWTDASGRPSSWNADPGRVRAALRLLGTAEIVPSKEEHDLGPERTVRAEEADGRSVEIWFGPRAAGGQTPIVVLIKGPDGVAERRIDGRIGSGVPDAFVRTDWTAWRDPTIFDAGASVVEAVNIESGSNRVRLERAARGWAVSEPFPFAADAGEVERMIGVLQGMRAASFDDAAQDDGVSGLDKPIATVRVESRAGVRTLSIGRTASADGKARFARVQADGALAGLRLDAEGLSRISAAPEAYVRRTPVGATIADVGGLRFVGKDGRVRLEAFRKQGQWTVGDAPASPAQRDAIDRAVRVLTSEPAAKVARAPAETDPAGQLGVIELLSPDGTPMAAVRLRTERAAQGGMHLLIASPADEGMELVWTAASEQAKGVVAWAAAMASGD